MKLPVLSIIFAIACSFTSAAERVDVVTTKEGKTFRGKIQSLSSAQIQISTDVGLISLPRDKVRSATSEEAHLNQDKPQPQLSHVVQNKPVPRLSVDGRNILNTTGQPIKLVGFNFWMSDRHHKQDVADAKAVGANHIRLMVPWGNGDAYIRDDDAPSRITAYQLDRLDEMVTWCADQEIWAIICIVSDSRSPRDDGTLYTKSPFRNDFETLWSFLSNRFKEHPFVGAYEIINEPNLEKVKLSASDLARWNSEMVRIIRAKDPRTPIVLSGPHGSNPYHLERNPVTVSPDIPNIVYTFHLYFHWEGITGNPTDLGVEDKTYGDTVRAPNNTRVAFSEVFIRNAIRAAERFSESKGVPVYMGEFGCWGDKPHQIRYVTDVLKEMDDNDISWAFFCWRGAYLFGVHAFRKQFEYFENAELKRVLQSFMHQR